MDPNCGITNQYLRPSFLIKVITGVFAFATLIYMFVLDKCLYEYVWRKPIHNGNIAATTTAFFILTIIVAFLIHFGVFDKIPLIGDNRLYQIFVAAGFALFTLLFALIFGIRNCSSSYKDKLCNEKYGTFYIYWETDHKDDEQYKDWERTHQNVDADKYFSNRTTKAGSNVLGLFITLACLYGALLFYYHQDDNSAGFTNINDPINSANTPSYN